MLANMQNMPSQLAGSLHHLAGGQFKLCLCCVFCVSSLMSYGKLLCYFSLYGLSMVYGWTLFNIEHLTSLLQAGNPTEQLQQQLADMERRCDVALEIIGRSGDVHTHLLALEDMHTRAHTHTYHM